MGGNVLSLNASAVDESCEEGVLSQSSALLFKPQNVGLRWHCILQALSVKHSSDRPKKAQEPACMGLCI
jgi:hypothetical protein